jgi:tetratricopeptide (TPR) repeat protein
MDERPYQTAHISQIEGRRFDERARARRPIREYFDIGAFGVNAFTAAEAGEELVEAHDELSGGADGHEELYFVSAGHAVFTVNGEEVDAPAGTFVFVRDPGATRSAVTAAPDTTVLIVGAPRGRVYRVGAWEYSSVGLARSGQDDYEGALAAFRQGLAEYPGDAGVLYNMACVESLEGDKDAALGHLREALASDPQNVPCWAADDADLYPIRGEEGYPF